MKSRRSIKAGYCYFFSDTHSYIFMKVIGVREDCVYTLEMIISSGEFLIERHRRSYNRVKALKRYNARKFAAILNYAELTLENAVKVFEKTPRLPLQEESKPGDCYCAENRLYEILNPVTMFRPSWNVSCKEIILSKNKGIADVYFRWGVNHDYFTRDIDRFNMISPEALHEFYNLIYSIYEKAKRLTQN